LLAAGDPLERLAAVIDFEGFRSDLEAALARSDRSKGGLPPPAFERVKDSLVWAVV
jgi:transposase, IS5 family